MDVIQAFEMLAERLESQSQVHLDISDNGSKNTPEYVDWRKRHKIKGEILRDVAGAIRGTLAELVNPTRPRRSREPE